MNIISEVNSFFKKNKISTNSSFIVTVSGGPDSMVMLHVALSMKLNFIALHCNFNLRGRESDLDEKHVDNFCNKNNIELIKTHFNTIEYCKERGISIEMGARDLRYQWFNKIKKERKIDYILIAHQSNDVAETIFINLCRGTGIRGLSGIKAINGDLIRPLLSISRSEIMEYINKNDISYRIDSSNNLTNYTRNKIRHKILPVCKEINPSILKTINNNCKNIREAEKLYDYAINNFKAKAVSYRNKEIRLDISTIINSPAPITLLFEILVSYGFNNHQCEDIIEGSKAISGKKFYSNSHTLVKEKGYWSLFRKINNNSTLIIEDEGIFLKDDKELNINIEDFDYNNGFPKNNDIALIDYDLIKFPLTLRHWEKGDSFYPIGKKKIHKKVSDFFCDLKFTQIEKSSCLIISKGKNIVWIVGYRPDDRYKVSPSTKKIIKITSKKLS